MSLIFILLGTFFLLAFLGVPIAVSLGVASGVGMLACDVQLTGIAQRMFAGVDSFSYLAIPMFMLAGKLMEYGRNFCQNRTGGKAPLRQGAGRIGHYHNRGVFVFCGTVRFRTGNRFRHWRNHVSGNAERWI